MGNVERSVVAAAANREGISTAFRGCSIADGGRFWSIVQGPVNCGNVYWCAGRWRLGRNGNAGQRPDFRTLVTLRGVCAAWLQNPGHWQPTLNACQAKSHIPAMGVSRR